MAGTCEQIELAQDRDRWRALVSRLSWLRIGTGGGHLSARYLTVGLTVPGSGMWGMDWIELAQDKDIWWALVSTVFNCRVP